MTKKKKDNWLETKGLKKWSALSYKQRLVRIAEYEKNLKLLSLAKKKKELENWKIK